MAIRPKIPGSRLDAPGSGFWAPGPGGEEGFMLLGLIVAIAILLMFLGVAASKEAFTLRREREVESARRADQYLRAIRRFYLKNQHYPGSIEQLENTNNVRYLRQRYLDPVSGKDYRLIPVGLNKTTVKGFFGQPLGGLESTGLGSAAGMQSPGMGGPVSAGPGANSGPNGGPVRGGMFGGGQNSGGLDTSSFGRSGLSASGLKGSGAGSSSPSPGTAGSAQPGSDPPGSGLTGLPGSPGSVGPFMGVGSSSTGASILAVNEKTAYEDWEFLYDPRLEKLRAAAALKAGPGSVGAGSLGTTPGGLGSTPAIPPPGGPAPPGGPPPQNPNQP